MLASVEYFWSGFFIVFIISIIKSKFGKNLYIQILSIPLIIITASMTEISGVSLFIYFTLNHVYKNNLKLSHILKMDKTNRINFIYIFSALTGALIVILSPGGLNRIVANDGELELFRFVFSSARVVYYFILSFYLGLIIIVVQISLLFERFNSFKKVLNNNNSIMFLSTAFIPIFPLALSSGFSLRILFIPSIFITLTILELTSELLQSNLKSKTIVFLVSSSLLTVVTLFTFMFNQIYMIQDIDARTVERDLYWFIEQANDFNWQDD
jgi:hypothetical protein